MASLDRQEVCNAIESLFESDTTLYGSEALINTITDNYVEYDKARISNQSPYKMFIKAPTKEKIDTRMGKNADYAFTVEYRIEGVKSDPQTAINKIDDIDERIDYLCSNEMWTGNNLSTHFTNTESTVVDIDFVGSTCDTRKDDGGWKVECEGTIRIVINRIKP